MFAVAWLMEWQNKITDIPPAITINWIKKYLNDWSLSSAKAERELGYHITPIEVGVRKTIDWLRENSINKLSCEVSFWCDKAAPIRQPGRVRELQFLHSGI